MKVPNILKRNPIAAIETELANLATRRDTLEKRQADATAKLEDARSARKAALSNDPGAELTGLTRVVRDGEDEVETLKGVIADLAEQTADAELRLIAAKDADVRAASASKLEQIATKFDGHAIELDAAISALGKAAAKMVDSLPETLKVVELDHDTAGRSDRERLVSIIIADGIASAFPAAVPMQAWGESYAGHTGALKRHFGLMSDQIRSYTNDMDELPLTTHQAAAAVVSERLRRRAEYIVAGDMSPNLEDQPIYRPEPAPKSIPLVEVFALENFAFQVEQGQAHTLIGKKWGHLIPEDAADVAVAASVALRTDTDAGAKAFQEQKALRASTPGSGFGGAFLSHAMCKDLGVIRKTADAATNVVALNDQAAAA